MEPDDRDASSFRVRPAPSVFLWPPTRAAVAGSEIADFGVDAGPVWEAADAPRPAALAAVDTLSFDNLTGVDAPAPPPPAVPDSRTPRAAGRLVLVALALAGGIQALAWAALIVAAPPRLERLASWTRSAPPAPLPATTNLIAPAVAAPPPTSVQPVIPVIPAPAEPRLHVRSDPPGARVMVGGRIRGTTPLTIEGLGPGRHRVRVEGADGWIEQTVSLNRTGTSALFVRMPADERAAPRLAGGWVYIVLPIIVDVYQGTRLVGSSLRGRLELPTGEYELELVNQALGYRERARATIRPGEVTRVRPFLPNGTLQLDAIPPAQVFVDGRLIGNTPLSDVRVPLGEREIRFSHPELGDQVRRVLVHALGPIRVSVDMRP